MDTTTNILKDSGNSKQIADAAIKILKEQGQEAYEQYLINEGARRQKEAAAAEAAAQAAAKAAQEASERQKAARRPTGGDIPDINNPARGKESESIQNAIDRAPVEKPKTPVANPRNLQQSLNILQPKSVVFGKYQLSEWQEDILTLIMEQLQGYMSKSLNLLKSDILGEIAIRIDLSKISSDGNKKKIIEQIDKLMNYRFEFWWNNENSPKGTRRIETKGIIVSTYHNYIGTSFVDIVISKWSLPFLLYYGKGIGASQFRRNSALFIPGKYSKRLYKLLAGYADVGTFDYKIDKMREEFIIPSSYQNAQIKKFIIDPAVEAINEHADFELTAEFVVTDTSKKKGQTKKTADTIHFTMKLKESAALAEEGFVSEDEMEKEVIRFLSQLLDNPYKKNLPTIARNWRNHGDIQFVYDKVRYYADQAQTGKMTPLKMKNFLLKAISEETHTQLRKTTRHVVRPEDEEANNLFN